MPDPDVTMPVPGGGSAMGRKTATRRLLFALAAATALLGMPPAWAHTVDKGLATFSVEGSEIRMHLMLAVSAITPQGVPGIDLGQPGAAPNYAPLGKAVEARLAVLGNGRPCTPAAPAVTPPPQDGGLVALDLRFDCHAALRTLEIRDDLSDILGAQYHTIANVQWPGGSQQFVFMTQARTLRVDLGGAAVSGPRGFFLLGIEHILTGYDHLLFLLALVLRGGNFVSLLKIVTAFTIAHSITLALAVLNIVVLPGRLVEATIAASIAYVAAENLFMKRPVSHRWAVSFLFGLVHGFGFSSVLRELGLPQQGLAWSLLTFNLGVEVGQAAAIVAILPLLLWARRFKWEPRAIAALSALVLAVGLVLLVERALFG